MFVSNPTSLKQRTRRPTDPPRPARLSIRVSAHTRSSIELTLSVSRGAHTDPSIQALEGSAAIGTCARHEPRHRSTCTTKIVPQSVFSLGSGCDARMWRSVRRVSCCCGKSRGLPAASEAARASRERASAGPSQYCFRLKSLSIHPRPARPRKNRRAQLRRLRQLLLLRPVLRPGGHGGRRRRGPGRRRRRRAARGAPRRVRHLGGRVLPDHWEAICGAQGAGFCGVFSSVSTEGTLSLFAQNVTCPLSGFEASACVSASVSASAQLVEPGSQSGATTGAEPCDALLYALMAKPEEPHIVRIGTTSSETPPYRACVIVVFWT